MLQNRVAKLAELAREVRQTNKPPVGRLMWFADKWDQEYQEVAREYANQQALLERQNRQSNRESQSGQQPGVAVAITKTSEVSTSPYAGIRATPGMIYQAGQNWVLIEARIRSGLLVTEIGRLLNPSLSVLDYKRVEEGKFLPSPDQIAQLCTLFGLPAEGTFIMAGPDAPPPGTRSTPIRGFSVIGVLRARRRLSTRALSEAITAETGVSVSSIFLSKLERGEWQPRVKGDPVEATWLEATALFLDIPVEWVNQQIPPALVQRAATNTRILHQAIHETARNMPLLDVDRPHLLTEGNDDE